MVGGCSGNELFQHTSGMLKYRGNSVRGAGSTRSWRVYSAIACFKASSRTNRQSSVFASSEVAMGEKVCRWRLNVKRSSIHCTMSKSVMLSLGRPNWWPPVTPVLDRTKPLWLRRTRTRGKTLGGILISSAIFTEEINPALQLSAK